MLIAFTISALSLISIVGMVIYKNWEIKVGRASLSEMHFADICLKTHFCDRTINLVSQAKDTVLNDSIHITKYVYLQCVRLREGVEHKIGQVPLYLFRNHRNGGESSSIFLNDISRFKQQLKEENVGQLNKN